MRHSHTKYDLDAHVVTDMYMSGKSINQIASELFCSGHVIVRILDGCNIVRRSGSPHQCTLLYENIRVNTDSGWEAHLYRILRSEFGDNVLFQGECGNRRHKTTSTIELVKPEEIRKQYAPDKKHYSWTPDFFIPALDMHLEAKGWLALSKWNEIIVPSILHTKIASPICVITQSPYKAKKWEDIQKLLIRVNP